MSRAILQFVAMIMLAFASIHSPSTLHDHDIDGHDHAVVAVDEHDDGTGPETLPDVDHGALAHDHHVPAGLDAPATFLAAMDANTSIILGSDDVTVLVPWRAPPITEPPAA